MGATEEAGGRAICVWYMPLRPGKASSGRPRRRLARSPPLALPPGHSAAYVVRALRSACCWGGAERPRRLLVIINPASGPGRWAGRLHSFGMGVVSCLLAGWWARSKVALRAVPPACGRWCGQRLTILVCRGEEAATPKALHPLVCFGMGVVSCYPRGAAGSTSGP